jgi:hypothetical protein
VAQISPERRTYYEGLMAWAWQGFMRRARARTPGNRNEVSARVIADALDLPGDTTESRRRRARELVDVMVENGYPIAASNAGYYAAITATDFEDYKQFLERQGLGHLAKRRDFDAQVARFEADGQQVMFAATGGTSEGTSGGGGTSGANVTTVH